MPARDDEPRSHMPAALEFTAVVRDGVVRDGVVRDGAPRDGAPRDGVARDRDVRERSVWQGWLESMARDPEVALAAAMAYRELSDAARESWLSSLAADIGGSQVPQIAVFGPLLGVEEDPERRRFLEQQIERDPVAPVSGVHRALMGVGPQGQVTLVLVMPLYLSFVQLLSCTILGDRFVEVRHDPIALGSRAPREYELFEGIRLESVSLKTALDLVAMAILKHRREGLPIPEAVRCLVDLLGQVGP